MCLFSFKYIMFAIITPLLLLFSSANVPGIKNFENAFNPLHKEFILVAFTR